MNKFYAYIQLLLAFLSMFWASVSGQRSHGLQGILQSTAAAAAAATIARTTSSYPRREKMHRQRQRRRLVEFPDDETVLPVLVGYDKSSVRSRLESLWGRFFQKSNDSNIALERVNAVKAQMNSSTVNELLEQEDGVLYVEPDGLLYKLGEVIPYGKDRIWRNPNTNLLSFSRYGIVSWRLDSTVVLLLRHLQWLAPFRYHRHSSR